MSIMSPEELFSKGQPARTIEVLAMLEANGFTDIRRTNGKGGTHIFYAHESLGITGTLVEDHGLVTIRYQKIAAKDCMKAIEKTESLRAEVQEAFQKTVEEKATARLAKIQEALPPYVEAFYGEGQSIIVRDKQVPQIGFTLHSEQEDHLLENKLRHELDSIKRDFFILLDRSHMEYDIYTLFDQDNNFTGEIAHSIYDMEPIVLPPYPEGQDPFGAICDYQDAVLEIDMAHAERKQTLLDKPFISRVLVAHHARRGERHNHVSYNIPGVDKNLSFTFETSSNQRVQGDGSMARISSKELAQLEQTIAGIERAVNASKTEYRKRIA